jgi:branched-chain amino acid transport system substrate-binding protein
MVAALEGYSFDSVKGKITIRAEDHAVLQPMFQAKLDASGVATLVNTVSAADTTPPVTPMKG